MLARRAFLASALASLCVAPRALASSTMAASSAGVLRFMQIRHRTVLYELGGRRVLVDPSFAANLGASALYAAKDSPIAPEDAGAIDVLCISSREPAAFDAQSTARLRGRTASCFVADERIASLLRYQGYSRVRVVVPGDRIETRGVTVIASPSRGLFGTAAVGFHLSGAARTVWHAGAPPPLDVDGGSYDFARAHPAEVMSVSAMGLSVGGTPATLDRGDARILAEVAHARYLAFLDADVELSASGCLLVTARPGKAIAPARTNAEVLTPDRGSFYRVLPPPG